MKKASHKPAAPKKGQPRPVAGQASGGQVDALFAEALGHHKAGRIAEAEAGYQAVLRLSPSHPHANNNLALILRAARRHEEALACYRRALEGSGAADPAVHSNHGCLLSDLGRWEEAAAALRRAVELKPDYAEAHFNLANTLRDLGDREGAVAAYEEALRLRPGMASALCNLGGVHKSAMALSRAADCFLAALRAEPQLAEAYNNLGETLKEMGRTEEAIGVFQSGLKQHPGHAVMHSNLLMALNYTPAVAPGEVFRAHLAWDARHGVRPVPARPPRDPDPGRRLRVGYVSPDFCAHSVAFFAEPLIREHDRGAFEVFCYSNGRRTDMVTRRLQETAQGWRPIAGLPDAEAARLIEADGIDILVDLAGHTANNRLPLFGLRPAPVQVSWLGYPNTTGMAAMDYRMTDAVADPMGVADRLSSETLVRLPRGFHCYQPPVDVPASPEPPSRRTGHVTFGSFNNTSKVTAEVARVWAAILARVPGSRLLVKSAQMADEGTRQRYLGYFTAHGIDPARIELLSRINAADGHLRAYDRVDVALDPFPYNGTTTTCEALWMGVPVVTLLGATHVARVGASLLAHCGLAELIAADEAGYVAAAAALATDAGRLAALRAGMRDRLSAAPLTDYKGFARIVETAYRAMWRERIAAA